MPDETNPPELSELGDLLDSVGLWRARTTMWTLDVEQSEPDIEDSSAETSQGVHPRDIYSAYMEGCGCNSCYRAVNVARERTLRGCTGQSSCPCDDCDYARVQNELRETRIRTSGTCTSCQTFNQYDVMNRAVHDGHSTTRCRLCTNCCDRVYWYCDNCNFYYSRRRVECPNSHNHYEEPDYDEYRSNSSYVIRSYSYRPNPTFYGEGPLYLGMELEVECGRNDRNELANVAQTGLGDIAYMKDDASISNGFEVVTHPMSYEYAMSDSFPWSVFDELTEKGCVTSENVGIHVHVSRAGFKNPIHIYRWMKFFYRNADAIRTIARRSSSWGAFNQNMREDIKLHCKGETGYYGAERYSAINVANEDTFEVRVFRSSLDKQEIQAALALVHASVEYTRNLTAKDILQNKGWEWTSFVNWLNDSYDALRKENDKLCVC